VSAIDFIHGLLQPVSQCIAKLDALYSNPELSHDALRQIGFAMAHSIREENSPEPTTPLEQALDNVQHTFERYAPQIKIEFEGKQTLCSEMAFQPVLKRISSDWNEIVKEPLVGHASAMFFLFSGNPHSADKILETYCKGAACAHPSLNFLRGFIERWSTDTYDYSSPLEYLHQWNIAVERLEETNKVLEARLREASARSPDKRECMAWRAWSAYSFFEHKVRNHIVFEGAREAIKARSLPIADKHSILGLALGYADQSRTFLEEGDLMLMGKANEYTYCDEASAERQRPSFSFAGKKAGWTVNDSLWRIRDWQVSIEKDEDYEYAASLDGIGLAHLASAVVYDSKVRAEAALEFFERSLRAGGAFHERYALQVAILEHREQARAFLGLD
jgi:hypothetical protein